MSRYNSGNNSSKINISNVIEESFNDYLSKNNIVYPNLCYSDIEKWNFEESLKKNNLFYSMDNPAKINSLQNLSEDIFDTEGEVKLVKFLGTIQNTFENQLYICAKYDKNNQKYLINKYYDNNSDLFLSLDDTYMAPYSSEKKNTDILGDRLRLELIQIKGLNNFLANEFQYKSKNERKVIVYDYKNEHTKINKNLLVIGAAYKKNNIITIHAWQIFEDYECLYISEAYKSLKLDNEISKLREKIKNIFLDIFKNDKLTSEYVLLFLFSQIFSRVGTKNVGSFPLNIILDKNFGDNEEYTNIYKKLFDIIKKISEKFIDIKLTTEELNNKKYFPIYDSEIEELYPGELQLSDGSFLLINEMEMNEGKLVENGIKNIACLKSIIDFQTIAYEYPYNRIEINHDIEVLIITKDTKSLLYSPFLTLLLSVPNQENNDKKDHSNNNSIKEEDFKKIFYYINYIRSNSSFLDKFTINEEVSQSIQKDYISNNANFKADEFDLVLKLSRFYALSNGRNYLTYDDYEYIYYFETQRKERINKYEKLKKSIK